MNEALLDRSGAMADAERMRSAHDLIAPHVVGDDGEQVDCTFLRIDTPFEESVDGKGGLVEHVSGRRASVTEALR